MTIKDTAGIIKPEHDCKEAENRRWCLLNYNVSSNGAKGWILENDEYLLAIVFFCPWCGQRLPS